MSIQAETIAMGKRISLTTSLASHNCQVSKGIKSLHRSHCSLGTQLRHSPMQSLFSTRDTNVRWQSDVDTVAKFLPVVAFGYQPILTTKVDYLIDPLQFLDVRLKSRSLDVWDYLENASYPIFLTKFFRVWVQQIRGFVLVPTSFESRPA